jgi:FkbM family methyltransferase
MKIISKSLNAIKRITNAYYRKSYSQLGEDLIIDFMINQFAIQKPSYLDIGAHHPTWLSNTYFFYKKGSNGVCVEPDPALLNRIKSVRPRDICLNVGVGLTEQTEADFYIMSERTLNTFSKPDAEKYQQYYDNCKLEKVVKIKMININDIIRENFSSCPNIVSIDVEGIDLEVLKSVNFNMYRPEIFCVETMLYNDDKSVCKSGEIINFMKNNGYFLYADTFINSIFVDSESYKKNNLPKITGTVDDCI